MQQFAIDGYKTVILDDPNNIAHAQNLLYQVYIHELRWNILNNNPSGMRIISNKNKKILVDDYDPSSIWVGTFHNNILVACGRIVNRDDQGLIEIERYNISEKLRSKISVSSCTNLIELNRSAIHPVYRNTIIWPCLLYFAFKYCETMKSAVIATTGYTKVEQFHKSIGFFELQGEEFYYFPTDENRVKVFYADLIDVKNISSTLLSILRRKLIK